MGRPTTASSRRPSFAELAAKFKGDKTHLFVVQQPIVAFLALNTQRPLFKDNPQLRRAVNYALDRPDARRACSASEGAKPNDEYLPPGFPGYQAKHVYPIDGPDLATAKRLAQGHLRGGHATFLACGSQSCVDRALVVAQALGKIGLHVRVKTSPGGSQLTLAAVRGTKFDITDVITRPDYGDPYALVDKLLDSRVIRVGRQHEPRVLREPEPQPRDRRGAAADRRRARPRLRPPRPRGRADRRAARRLRGPERARLPLDSASTASRYQPVYGLDLAALPAADSARLR